MKFLNLKNIFISLIILNLIFLSGCGLYKKSDARKVPGNAKERVKLAVKEGKKLGLVTYKADQENLNLHLQTKCGELIEILDFIPLSNADYGGGIIITDWYNEGNEGRP